MRAGKLRHRVQIGIHEIEETEFGEREAEDPTVKATVWAEVVTLTGRELERARQVAAEATHQITIRYYRGLTTKHKILWTDPLTKLQHEYDINQINDIDQRHIEMVLIAKEALE